MRVGMVALMLAGALKYVLVIAAVALILIVAGRAVVRALRHLIVHLWPH